MSAAKRNARIVRVFCSFCKRAGHNRRGCDQLRAASNLPLITCGRLPCRKPVPPSFVWRKAAWGTYCGWACYFEDVYDDAEQDAAAEGLTGRALQERAAALYMARTHLGEPAWRVRPRSAGEPASSALPASDGGCR